MFRRLSLACAAPLAMMILNTVANAAPVTAGTAQPSALPELAAMFLLGSGLAGVAAWARRRKHTGAVRHGL